MTPYDVANSAILITGPARSGTTIMGRVIHSMTEVEYAFEPTFLALLAPRLTDARVRSAYESWLFQNVLLDSLAGRSINANCHDESAFVKAKGSIEMAKRLASSWTSEELIPLAEGKRVAYKLPEIARTGLRMLEYYPGMSILGMVREPAEVVASLLAKGWFANNAGGYYPLELDEWPSHWDELTRCWYYWCEMTKPLLNDDRVFHVSYERLVKSPRSQVKRIAMALGLHYGPMTLDIVGTIKRQKQGPEPAIPTEMWSRVAEVKALMHARLG